MQFNCGGGGSTQHILERKNLVFAVRGQIGLLLLEDGEGQHVTTKGGGEEAQNKG